MNLYNVLVEDNENTLTYLSLLRCYLIERSKNFDDSIVCACIDIIKKEIPVLSEDQPPTGMR